MVQRNNKRRIVNEFMRRKKAEAVKADTERRHNEVNWNKRQLSVSKELEVLRKKRDEAEKEKKKQEYLDRQKKKEREEKIKKAKEAEFQKVKDAIQEKKQKLLELKEEEEERLE